jgi:hypothetical protein
VRGKQERLITTLFTDNTLVYLDASDDVGALTDILDEWRLRDKFNIGKTEIIHTGKINPRDRVRATRFVNGMHGTLIPEHIKIAAEREPIRTLGAWVGNGVEKIGTWSRTSIYLSSRMSQPLSWIVPGAIRGVFEGCLQSENVVNTSLAR